MSLHRFKFICHLITFTDKETRNERWKTDKFACMRELFEDMNKRNARMRYPSPLLAIDENLCPHRGHIGFKQCNPNKRLSMAYCTKVSAIVQYLTPAIAYHFMRNHKELKVQLESITSSEPTTNPNIPSTSCLYTATLKGSIYPWIATSHQFLWQHGL